MNEFLVGFQGGQSLRLSTQKPAAEFISEIAESLKSTPPGTVKWHQGNGYLINLSHLSYIAPASASALEGNRYGP